MQQRPSQRHGIRYRVDARHHVIFERYDPDGRGVGRQVEDVKTDRDGGCDPPRCRIKAEHGLQIIAADPDTAGADCYSTREVAASREERAHRRIVDGPGLAAGLQEVRVGDRDREHIEPMRAADPV